jgi:preprotein translocase subunit SecE
VDQGTTPSHLLKKAVQNVWKSKNFAGTAESILCIKKRNNDETGNDSRRNSMKFLKSVADEMKQVTWPTGKELAKYTNTVVVTTILFALFFAVVDFGITEAMDLILN